MNTDRRASIGLGKPLVVLAVSLAMNAILVFAISRTAAQAQAEIDRQVRARQIYSQATAVSKQFYDAATAMGGYSITKSDVFLKKYDLFKKRIPQGIASLKMLVEADAEQTKVVEQLEKSANEGFAVMEDAKVAIDENKVDVAQFKARHMYKATKEVADQMQRDLKDLDCNVATAGGISGNYAGIYRSLLDNALALSLSINAVVTVAMFFCLRGSDRRAVA